MVPSRSTTLFAEGFRLPLSLVHAHVFWRSRTNRRSPAGGGGDATFKQKRTGKVDWFIDWFKRHAPPMKSCHAGEKQYDIDDKPTKENVPRGHTFAQHRAKKPRRKPNETNRPQTE